MYSAIERQQLFSVTRQSIQHGLQFGTRIELDLMHYSARLQESKATFVTLKIDELLRGCIGNLLPSHTLVENIAHNAYSAAFHDPRFGSLRADEFSLLKIEISILSELRPMIFQSEQDLVAQLRPGTDGLLLRVGEHSATFLPSVWQQLPNPWRFLTQLKEKAGLAKDEWPDGIVAERYTTHTISG